jgi:hypothetical protein
MVIAITVHLQAQRELRRQFPDGTFVFPVERGGIHGGRRQSPPQRIGESARLPAVYAHIVRQDCDSALANAGMIRGLFKAVGRSST